MRLIKDNFDWQEYIGGLDMTGVAGHPYPFDHVNEPEEFPCVCETMIDHDKPGPVQLVHVFFTSDDAQLLTGLNVRGMPFEEPEEENA